MNKYSKAIIKGIAGFIILGVFISENEINEFYEQVRGIEIMEATTIQEKCELYERCHKQPHVEVAAVSGISTSTGIGPYVPS